MSPARAFCSLSLLLLIYTFYGQMNLHFLCPFSVRFVWFSGQSISARFFIRPARFDFDYATQRDGYFQ